MTPEQDKHPGKHDDDPHSTGKLRTVPGGALVFSFGPCQFGSRQENGTIPVSLVARSNEAINHWFWGPVVHDIAGMRRHKGQIALDYAHYDQEVLGYVDTFEATSRGLEVSGKLTPFTEGDRASEIVFKAKAGVPYESSIFFGDPIVEEVPAGKTAEANGRTFAGPIAIIREWDLRGIAICPYGADKDTPVKLSSGDQIQVCVFTRKEHAMADEAKPVGKPEETPAQKPAESPPAAPAQKPAESPPAAPAVGQQAARTGREFLNAFGQQGAVWFVEGKSWDEAQKLFTDGLKAENEDLKAKLAGVTFGLREGVSASPADDDPASHQATGNRVGQRLSAIAGELAAAAHRN